MEDRNPSPPPEFEKESEIYQPDSVGGTAISKHWVITTLMEIITEVEKHSENKEEELIEVSDELQDNACRLWDVCADKDVAVYLLEFDIIEILYGVILKSKAPRLTEIAVGILGNMACSDAACEAISKLKHLRSAVVELLSSLDTQTLLETVRFLKICVSNPKSRHDWSSSVEENLQDFVDYCQYILSSSTNAKLLGTISELLDILFEYSTTLLKSCATEAFIDASIEAIQQQMVVERTNSLQRLCHSLHALHTIVDTVDGFRALAPHRRRLAAVLASLFYEWTTNHSKTDVAAAEGQMSSSEVSVSCSLSLISCVLEAVPAEGGCQGDADNDSGIRKDVGNSVEKSNGKHSDSSSEKHNGREANTDTERDDKEREKKRIGEIDNEDVEEKKIVKEIDDEDREMMIKFAHAVLTSKGVVSALPMVSESKEKSEDTNEFKTPLQFRSSPRVPTPRSILLGKGGVIKPVVDGEDLTLVQTPEIHQVNPGERTPTSDEDEDASLTATESQRDDDLMKLPPPSVLCNLANDVISSAMKRGWFVGVQSPKKSMLR